MRASISFTLPLYLHGVWGGDSPTPSLPLLLNKAALLPTVVLPLPVLACMAFLFTFLCHISAGMSLPVSRMRAGGRKGGGRNLKNAEDAACADSVPAIHAGARIFLFRRALLLSACFPAPIDSTC